MANLTKARQRERDEAIATLHTILSPGDTVYCVPRHCSRSGMSHVIDLVVRGKESGVHSVGRLAAIAIGQPYDHKRSGVSIGGCGMDMGFQLVYLLGCTMWPHGTPSPHGTRNGESDSDGGYALSREWL